MTYLKKKKTFYPSTLSNYLCASLINVFLSPLSHVIRWICRGGGGLIGCCGRRGSGRKTFQKLTKKFRNFWSGF